MSHTKYDNYTVDDFASDEHFIDWCLNESTTEQTFWADWLQAHPHKKETVFAARKLVSLLHKAEKTKVQSAMKKDIWKELNTHIANEKSVKPKTKTSYFSIKRTLAIAASFLFLFVSYQLFDNSSEQIEWTVQANLSDEVEQIHLSDGTEVSLKPNSSIEYSNLFGGEKREIILYGEAFFAVARDTSLPFLVYANETITKVLGTSFLVSAIEGKETVDVEVETGSVAVFANVANKKGSEQPAVIFKKGAVEIPQPNHKVHLSPNEKITFDTNKKRIAKGLISAPKLLKHNTNTYETNYKNAAVTDIFRALEVAYGIKMDYAQDELKTCSISTILDDSPLFTKLDIICAALDLKYEQNNAIIYISGSGC